MTSTQEKGSPAPNKTTLPPGGEAGEGVKEELKEELKDTKVIYVVGIAKGTNPAWDRGIWRKFRLYYVKDGELREIWFSAEEKDTPPLWVPIRKTKSGKWKGGYFESKVLGMDRAFEIIYQLGRWLFDDGYRFQYKFLSYER
jgi:hypothetical protein